MEEDIDDAATANDGEPESEAATASEPTEGSAADETVEEVEDALA